MRTKIRFSAIIGNHHVIAPSELKKTCLEIQPVVTQKTMIVVINNDEAVQFRTWFPDTELLTVSEAGEIAGLVNHFMAQF